MLLLLSVKDKQQLIPTDHYGPGFPTDDCHMRGPLLTINEILQKLLKVKQELL